MNQHQLTIQAFVKLGEYILSQPEELNQIIQIAKFNNGWFDQHNSQHALSSIATNFLQRDIIEKFLSNYESPTLQPKNIGLILAGNIPLVGFHDILCTILSGHNAVVKLSSKDDKLSRAILMKLIQLEPLLEKKINLVEQVRDIDAVIATGSNNSARYFEQYFGKYPNIIRKNRTSLAVITGDESDEDYQNLGTDIFQYYGLGCRNVASLFVPKGFNFSPLLDQLNTFTSVLNNQKYKNNFDYNLTLLLLNKIPFLQGESILLTEDPSLNSRIGIVHYQEYDDDDQINNFIIEHSEKIQVVVGKEFTPFGNTQNPMITDFADRIDTMEFLSAL